MGIFDSIKDAVSGGNHDDIAAKAKEQVNAHEAQIDQGVEKAGDFIDDKTKGKYSDKIDKAVDTIQQKTGSGDTTTGTTPDTKHHGANLDGDTTAP